MDERLDAREFLVMDVEFWTAWVLCEGVDGRGKVCGDGGLHGSWGEPRACT